MVSVMVGAHVALQAIGANTRTHAHTLARLPLTQVLQWSQPDGTLRVAIHVDNGT